MRWNAGLFSIGTGGCFGLEYATEGKPAGRQHKSVFKTVPSDVQQLNAASVCLDDSEKEKLVTKFSEHGFTNDDSYFAIYGSLHKDEGRTASEIHNITNARTSKSTVTDKLVRLEICGFAKKLRSGSGISTSWVRA